MSAMNKLVSGRGKV